MKTSLPYFKQQTPFTCSLACLRMVLESIGIKTTEYELAKTINFSPRIGVSPNMIKIICEHLKIKYNSHFNSSLEELKETIKTGLYPIVLVKPSILYNLPELEHAHYIIVKDIIEESIIINDPDQEYGEENKKADLDRFVEAWNSKSRLIFVLWGRV